MTTVRLLAELKRRQQMSVTLLQQLDEQFDLKEAPRRTRQSGLLYSATRPRLQ